MKNIKALVLGLLIIAPLLLVQAGGAAAQPPKLEAFLLTGRMQAHLLRGIVKVYGDAVIGLDKAESGFGSQMASFEALAAKLKPMLALNEPGSENLSKYFEKLMTRQRTVEKEGAKLLEDRGKGRKIKVSDIAPLEKAAFQTVYAARQLMRNLVRSIEPEEMSPEDRERIGEALLVAEMQGHLLSSIKAAFADNIRCNIAPADTFWLDLASFDILVTVYRSRIADGGEESAKSKALKQLLALKHDILLEGEAMYLVAKTCKPDLEAARAVEGAAGKILPLFQTMIQEALK